MTTVHETQHYINITITKRPDLNLSSVYDRDFFMAFDLKHFRLERIGPNEPIINELEQSNIILPENKVEGPDLADELLGPEHLPNGYSELPLDLQNISSPNNQNVQDLQKYTIEENDSDTDDESYDIEQKGGTTFLENIQYYTHRYLVKPFQTEVDGLSNETIQMSAEDKLISPDVLNKDIVVSFSRQHLIQTLAQFTTELKEDPASIMNFSNTGISYLTLENILKDLLVHFDMFYKEDVIITQIRPEFIYIVQDRYLLLDGESLVKMDNDDVMKRGQIATANKAILDFVFDLLEKKDRDVVVSLAEIRGTKVYKLLRRLELEDIFGWV